MASTGGLLPAQGGPAPLPVNLGPPLPTTLPDNLVPARSLNKHYSLPQSLLESGPLAAQMQHFKSWCTQQVNMAREGGSLSARTWKNIQQSIVCYLGFCHTYLSLEAPCLQEFSQAEQYGLYMSFLLAKELSIHSLTQQISHARKVLLYQEQVAQGGAAAAAAGFARVAVWMGQLRAQLVCSVPRRRKAPDQLEEEGAWLPPAELVALFEELKVLALQAVPAQGEQCSLGGARLLHDACLTSCMCGYLPPIRLTCIRSLQVPSADGGCLDNECHLSRCKGNRIAVRQGGELWLELPHHKNQRRWHADAIIVRLPGELAQLVYTSLLQGHAVLSPGMPYMFCDKKGRLFQSAAPFCHYFNKVLQRIGSPAVFPPSRIRHIFVDERRSLDAAPGPSNVGAATVMGNSVGQWDRSYDLGMRSRETQAAVDAMPQWREAMLERSRGPVLQALAAAAVAEGGEGSDDSFASCS